MWLPAIILIVSWYCFQLLTSPRPFYWLPFLCARHVEREPPQDQANHLEYGHLVPHLYPLMEYSYRRKDSKAQHLCLSNLTDYCANSSFYCSKRPYGKPRSKIGHFLKLPCCSDLQSFLVVSVLQLHYSSLQYHMHLLKPEQRPNYHSLFDILFVKQVD